MLKCLKRRLFAPSCVKNARNTQSISVLFALAGTNLRPFQMLRSFEGKIFFTVKDKSPKRKCVSGTFACRGDGYIQNHFISAVHHPF